ncbi:MAG: transposase [Actinobacteria bacterium]|nr:transposase [Actinomycetota bacterium]
MHDCYQNYYNAEWEHLAGHQACASHLLREGTAAAETYPGAVWPEQAQRALRGLIHAFNQARDDRYHLAAKLSEAVDAVRRAALATRPELKHNPLAVG